MPQRPAISASSICMNVAGAEQSGRELTSTDPTAGAQDAALQERLLRAETPLSPHSRAQHLHRQMLLTSVQPHRVLRAPATSTWREAVAAARRSVTPLQSARAFHVAT